ncbi:uncharacterized protein LOC117794084 [Drosophila innubila]|uniref:uncharacterized protein LOC117794084 n=1 Tax=Drosophila innubila TaxID=198719 RepID=UPI00148C5664|nr:uncharacterized protein LOC117794084 [Drosophila innubila]
MSTNVEHNDDTDNLTDGNETLRQIVEDMGYPEKEARRALKYAGNNIEMAVQYLLEGDALEGDEEISEVALQRRNRRRYKQLRKGLMDNPALNDYAIASLMKKSRNAEALRDIVDNHSVQFLSSLLESSSDEEDSNPQQLATKSSM